MVIVFCVVAVTFPALLVYLCYRFAPLRTIGTVVLCYITGMVLGNIGLLP